MLHRYTSNRRHWWRECVRSDRRLFIVVGLKPGHSDGASGTVSMSVTYVLTSLLGESLGVVVIVFGEIIWGTIRIGLLRKGEASAVERRTLTEQLH